MEIVISDIYRCDECNQQRQGGHVRVKHGALHLCTTCLIALRDKLLTLLPVD